MKFLSALLVVAAGRATAKNLRTTEHRELKPEVQCLMAVMEPFGSTYPNVKGEVKVCFDGELSPTSGTLDMDVDGLQPKIKDGGVHIHKGISCDTSMTQMGHYFLLDETTGIEKDGDPWYNTRDKDIAPTGAKYSTNKKGTGKADFEFDQGYGYDDTDGKVVVIHDSRKGTYARVACGKLMAV